MKCKDCNNYACPERSNGEMECIFQQWTAKQFDWESFRAEAAKDILCAMIAKGEKVKPIVVDIAIDGADELIKQLKEREKK